MITRNAFLSEVRRNRFRGDYDEVAAERITAGGSGQEAPLHLADLHRALQTAARTARGGAAGGGRGLQHEEAAQIAGCAVGTIKSRVARGGRR